MTEPVPIEPAKSESNAADVNGVGLPPTQSWMRVWGKRIATFAIIAIVLYYLRLSLTNAYDEWRNQPEPTPVAPGWLVGSIAFYAIGLATLAIPYWLILRDLKVPVGFGPITRSYIISHLGKYVPGKAMAIVIRCGLLVPRGASATVVTLSTFYETFATMASGALLALLLLFFAPTPASFRSIFFDEAIPIRLLLVAGLAAGFTGSVVPHLFSWMTQIAARVFRRIGLEPMPPLRYRTFVMVLVLGGISWTFQGLSFWAAANCLLPTPTGLETLPMMIIIAGLGTVLGFVSMMPGQFGVREVVVMQSLEPVIGAIPAVLAAVIARVVSILVEFVLGGALYAWDLRR